MEDRPRRARRPDAAAGRRADFRKGRRGFRRISGRRWTRPSSSAAVACTSARAAPATAWTRAAGSWAVPTCLRSQLVLNDQDGELIAPVIKNGRPGTLMVPLAVADADIKAIAGYLHGLQAQGSNQGGPPPGPPVELNILLGDAKAGEKYFAAKCSTCHSAAADLQGLATRVPDPKTLQNLWVSGGRAAGAAQGRRPAALGVERAHGDRDAPLG